MPHVLTLDVGTSSVRALLFDPQGRAVKGIRSRVTYAMRTMQDGGVEIDAGELLGAVLSVLDQAVRQVEAAGRSVGGVATCTFWHSLVGVDADGGAVTPVYTWADTRSDAERGELRKVMDEPAFHARTGGLFHSCYHPAKLSWLRRTDPAQFGKADRWMSFGEFLFLRLFGRTSVSVSMASGTGLLDVHRCAWDAEVLGAIGIREEQLSPIGDVGDPLSGLGADFASRWPALKDVPWTPAVGDGACNNLGSGCATSDRIAVMIGTSGAMRAICRVDDVEIPDGLFCYRADRRRFVMGGALSNGGNLVEWARRTFQLPSAPEVEEQISGMAPGAHGLVFLPFLAGERSPGWAASATASIQGLRLDSSPVEILRAGMEAVAFRFALIHRLLEASVPQAGEIVASGGALLSSPAWLQILTDVLGRPVRVFEEGEASSRGAALLTLESMGALKRLEDVPVTLGRTFEPDRARHDRYLEAIERQQELYGVLVQGT